MDIGNYTKAIEQFKQYSRISRMAKDTIRLCSSLKNIGYAYNLLGDIDQAIIYYDEILSLDNSGKGILNLFNKADINRNIGIIYFDKNDFKKAMYHLKEAKRIAPNDLIKNRYTFNKFSININYDIAKVYLELNNLDSLKHYVQTSFEFCKSEFEVQKDLGYELLGKYYLNNGDFTKAEYFIQLTKKITIEKFKNYKKHISFSDINNLLSSLYYKKGDNQNALKHYIIAIHNLKRSASMDSSSLIPDIHDIYNPLKAIDSYMGIAKAYHSNFKQSKDFNHLELAYKSLINAAALIPKVRNTFQEESSLLRFSEIALPIYEMGIASAIELYDLTDKEKYLFEAFNFNEKNKAILLLESINKSQAIQFANIPDSLLQKEKELKLQISSINRNLYEEQNVLENSNTRKIEKLKRQLFTDSEEYDALIRTFEKEYAEYYDLKYNYSTVSVKEIQKKLINSNTQLIEFFSGNKYTYIFSISENEIKVNAVSHQDELNHDIQFVNDFISMPPNTNTIKKQLSSYIKSSKNIFDQFIKEAIFPESKHLVIITDGILGYIPFEAIVTKEPKSSNVSFSLENLSYLMEDYEISYSYSSTLFLNSLDMQEYLSENTFLGIAPSFGQLNENLQTRICNENALYSLQCSEAEVARIKNKIGGKILVGNEATLQNTKKELSNARIIHLATHACLDDTNPEFNKIYLADNYLSNNELYTLKLNSELAVLSACETGSGTLAKGEGVMSLARGFIHAGCPSIIMSLWSIDDCATSKIMVSFYNELYKGKSKTEALRNAKLKYIKKAKKVNQHPYYWAAFVQIGNYNPIEISSPKTNLLYAFGFLSFAVLIFIGIKKYKKS